MSGVGVLADSAAGEAPPITSFQLPPVTANTMQMLPKKKKDPSLRAWDSSTQIKKTPGLYREAQRGPNNENF